MVVNQPRLSAFLVSAALLQAAACGDKQAESKPAAEPKKAAPEITVAERVYDFGRVPRGSRVSHVFKIKNTGTADLVIENTAGS